MFQEIRAVQSGGAANSDQVRYKYLDSLGLGNLLEITNKLRNAELASNVCLPKPNKMKWEKLAKIEILRLIFY